MSTQEPDIEKGEVARADEPIAVNDPSKKGSQSNHPGSSSGMNRKQDPEMEKVVTQAEAMPSVVNDPPKREFKRNNPGGTSGPSRRQPGTTEATKSSDFDHPTSKVWAVYNSETAPFDKAVIESWTKDMDGILIFSGLFSAVVSAFLVDGYKNLTQDSGDATVVLLAHISLQLATASNGSQIGSISPPNDFKPTNSTISVNILWFISLILALICALTATLVQQWARDYQQSIEHRPTPHTKALIRSFLFDGVESFKMAAVVDGIPTLLHVAVLLFILGLIQFLFSINLVVAGVILGVFLLFALLYFGVTLLPTIWAQCPYRTPFSTISRYSIIWALNLIFNTLSKVYIATPSGSFLNEWLLDWARKLEEITPGYNWTEFRESAAVNLNSEAAKRRIDKALRWTLDSLTTDSELEPFVAGLPALLSISSDHSESQMVSDVMTSILLEPQALASRIARLLHTCITPTTLSDEPRIKRMTICIQAVEAICNTKRVERDRSLLTLVGRLEEGKFSVALSSLTRLYSHPELASSAESLTRFIATMIEASLHNGEKPSGGSELSAASRFFYGTGRFQSLGLLVKDRTVYSMNAFTDLLAEHSQETGEPVSERQRYMQEYLKVIYSWANIEFKPPLVIKSLANFSDSKQTSIAHCANCESASWAIHMQCHLLGNSPAHVPNIVEALTVFGTMPFEGCDVIGSIVYNREVSLGIPAYDSAITGIGKLREWWMLVNPPSFSEGSSEADSSLQYDRALLDALTMADIYGFPVRTGYWGRVAISRGHTVILIIFLSSMKTFPPPEDTLYLTLDTLQLITASLTVSYSSASIQTALIQLVKWTFDQLRAHLKLEDRPTDLLLNQGAQEAEKKDLVDDSIVEIPLGANTACASISSAGLGATAKYILPILRTLLNVIGTVAHPDSIVEARKVVMTICNEFTVDEFPALHNDAANVLEKLHAKQAFAFDEKLLGDPGELA